MGTLRQPGCRATVREEYHHPGERSAAASRTASPSGSSPHAARCSSSSAMPSASPASAGGLPGCRGELPSSAVSWTSFAGWLTGSGVVARTHRSRFSGRVIPPEILLLVLSQAASNRPTAPRTARWRDAQRGPGPPPTFRRSRRARYSRERRHARRSKLIASTPSGTFSLSADRRSPGVQRSH